MNPSTHVSFRQNPFNTYTQFFSPTLGSDFSNFQSHLVSHEANDAKDHKPSKETRQAVTDRYED